MDGSAQEGFRLTLRGNQVAEKIGRQLKLGKVRKPKRASTTKTRGKEEAVVRYVRGSTVFKRWSTAPDSFLISESELRSLLNATLESPEEVLRENLDYYRENAKLLNDTEVFDFLHVCESKHSDVLSRR